MLFRSLSLDCSMPVVVTMISLVVSMESDVFGVEYVTSGVGVVEGMTPCWALWLLALVSSEEVETRRRLRGGCWWEGMMIGYNANGFGELMEVWRYISGF